MPLDRALDTLPAVTLDERAAAAIGTGQQPFVEGGAAVAGVPRGVVFRDANGRALALGSLEPEGGRLRARASVVFPWAARQGRGGA